MEFFSIEDYNKVAHDLSENAIIYLTSRDPERSKSWPKILRVEYLENAYILYKIENNFDPSPRCHSSSKLQSYLVRAILLLLL